MFIAIVRTIDADQQVADSNVYHDTVSLARLDGRLMAGECYEHKYTNLCIEIRTREGNLAERREFYPNGDIRPLEGKG